MLSDMYVQLNFIDDFFPKSEKPRESYWKRFFNWEPLVGELARIDAVISFCETLGRRSYCYCMRVKILEINDGEARVETTREWEDACSRAGAKGGSNSAGTIWIVDIDDLAPILNK